MRVASGFAWVVAVGLSSLTGCTGEGGPDAGPPDAGEAEDAQGADAGAPEAGPADTGLFADHDGGGFITCSHSCTCPQGMGCVEGLCRNLGTPVWCCARPGCPSGATCLDERDHPGQCPLEADGGVGDSGPGQVGDSCERDSDCDSALLLTCWTRDEPPFVWGYCTREDCTGGCPSGSECLTFNDADQTTGCMKTCADDTECRADAFCLGIAGAPFGGVCLPDCRDDLLDCAPRDGTRYCDPLTGQCEVTPSQSSSAQIGDPCTDATYCGAGQTCMTTAGWGLPGGLCTQVCSGLPEADPCPGGTSCRDFGGIGLCFVDCVNGACPNRTGAVCTSLAAGWPQPACVPQ
ncbi:MAG: hypothetical protein H6730_34505 [Deltaproteobacteria bacterium]|nr:hypothetical protein [Deltaproteobacteria bacterium]